MKRIKIKLGIIGFLPFAFNRKKITKWKSNLFEIVDDFKKYHINAKSDTVNWGYSDSLLEKELPIISDADIFIGITYVPIEHNYYARRLNKNRVILSYNDMEEIISNKKFPIENLLLRVLYEYSIIYLRYGNRIPLCTEDTNFTHDDTRGCIFDMNGTLSDIVFSLHKPVICDVCRDNLRQENISDNIIKIAKKEIKRIKKDRYYKISDFIKKKPILSLLISFFVGIILSIIASSIYDYAIKYFIEKLKVKENIEKVETK
ncbi:MAG: hypothetical protein H8D45_21615 [Bacteroidetes bacterium]|nr:hypothetical protein [Bacteroidota bacterium]MBL7105629.1 hypothetical protein [Bacteroidales bacterium]